MWEIDSAAARGDLKAVKHVMKQVPALDAKYWARIKTYNITCVDLMLSSHVEH